MMVKNKIKTFEKKIKLNDVAPSTAFSDNYFLKLDLLHKNEFVL